MCNGKPWGEAVVTSLMNEFAVVSSRMSTTGYARYTSLSNQLVKQNLANFTALLFSWEPAL